MIFLLLALLLSPAIVGCGGGPQRPPPSSAQRFNGEGLRRLERGDARGAEEMFHDALREAELVDDLLGQAEAWNNLGALAVARGQHAEAWAFHSNALRLHRARSVRDAGEIRTRTNLGGAMLMAGAVAEAEEQFRVASDLSRHINEPRSGAMARVGLAAVALRRNSAAEAERLAHEVVAEARAAKDLGPQAAALSIEGAALELQGKLDDAHARYEEALDIDRKREQPQSVVGDLRALARLTERRGDRSGAAAYLARSARISRRLGDTAEAERELQKAIDLLGDQGDEAQALKAELQALKGRPPPASPR